MGIFRGRWEGEERVGWDSREGLSKNINIKEKGGERMEADRCGALVGDGTKEMTENLSIAEVGTWSGSEAGAAKWENEVEGRR